MQKSIVKNAIYKMLLSTFNLIIPIVITPYVYRVLGPQNMGRVSFSESLYGYFLIFASFGIYNYGIREISRVRENKENLKKSFSELLLIGFFTTLLTAIVYIIFIYKNYRGSLYYPILIIHLIQLFANIFYVEWANEGVEKYSFITAKTIIIRVLYVIFLFLLVKGAEDYLIYPLLLSLMILANNVISFIFIVRDIGIRLRCLSIWKHMVPLLIMVIINNANILYTQLDQILLGTYLYPEAVAYYAIGQKIMIVINGVVLSVMEVALPRLSNYSEKGNEEEYISLLNRVSIFFFAMLFPIAMGITALSREIIVLFGGDQYLPATGVLSIFGIYMIGVGIQYIISKQILYVKGKERIIVGSVIGGGVLNLMMNILLLSLGLFTPQTAIITTCVAIFFQVTIMYTIIRKYMKIDYKLLTWDKLKYLAISISFIPIAYLVRKVLIRTSKVTIVTVVVCAAIYLLFLILIKDSNLYFVLERIRVGKNKEELIPSQKGGRGMNIQEFRILKLIHRNTKQNLLEISEQMGLSQGTVKNLTYYLLENAYIKQNFKGEYTITSKGLEMIEEAIIKTAVILAAGIKPETNHIVKDVIPKELLQIDEKTLSLGEKGLVERSIQILLKNGIERIIIVTGHQSRFYNELTERYKCVYVIENIDYASTGSMASLAKIVDFIDSNFILLENHLIYEEKAIKQLQNTEKKDCILISNIANSGDEVYVEIINNNINKISKSKEALGSIYGEWVGITKISKELLDLMMLAYSKTTNPYYDYKYAIEDVARNYMVGFQKIDHLIWTKVKEVSIND